LYFTDEDYEDEMKGYSGLTIKPKKPSSIESSESNKSPSHRDKHTSSPTRRAIEISLDKLPPITSSHNSPSASPRKRSRTSSERSDKESKSSSERTESKGSRYSKEKRGLGKGRGTREKEESEPTRKTKSDAGQWKDSKDYRERQKAVLKRSYRKAPGVAELEESENKVPDLVLDQSAIPSVDVDLRFQVPQDVDLRSEVDVPKKGEPPSKKSRSGSNLNTIDQYYTFSIIPSFLSLVIKYECLHKKFLKHILSIST
jgi:hypothetical protein